MVSTKKGTKKTAEEVLGEKLSKKKKDLVGCEEKILHLSDEIKLKSKDLKQLRASEKSVRVAHARMDTHMKSWKTDMKNRPSDRSDDIRLYTKMDLDVWAYPQVRSWFNKMSPEDNKKETDQEAPWQTGYMIRV